MRLLFVIDNLGSGGAQRQMANLALGLTARAHQVDFYIYYPEHDHFVGILQDAGIRIRICEKQGRFDWQPIRNLRKLVSSDEYNLALAFLATPAFYLEIAAIGQRMPIVVSERFMYITQSLGMSKRLLQQFHRLAAHITVNSHHQYQRMIKFFPWMQPRLSVIYNGVDLNTFHPSCRSMTGRSESKNYRFLVLSSVLPKKNSLRLIQALAEFLHTHPEYQGRVTIQWAGQVVKDQIAQDEFKRANTLIHSLGLQECWQWLGERSDVPDLLCNADALIHPALYEGLPNAICEALASGLPVLASNIGDHPRLIDPGQTGFLFSPTEIDSIANVLYSFCCLSETERIKMSQNARRFAEQSLSMERFVRGYESLFEQLVVSR